MTLTPTLLQTMNYEIEDTMSLLEKYVGEIDSKVLDKPKLNKLLKGLYIEAQEIE